MLTAHRSKGLEWDLVVVAGVQEGTWPDLRQRGSLLGMDELVESPPVGWTSGPDAAERGAPPRWSPSCWTRSAGCSTSR